MTWQLQSEFSDSFNYSGKKDEFNRRWKSRYVNDWEGPGRTKWKESLSTVKGGKLVLWSAPNSDKEVNMGIISSKTPVSYPVFIEASIKPANLELSSNIWMISKDQTQELDILEIYAGSAEKAMTLKAGSNYHIFLRDPKTQDILNNFDDSTKHTTDKNNGLWREDFHRFGVHWKSPTEIDIYIDGVKTKDGSWSQADMNDRGKKVKLDKTKYSISKPMYIVIDLEEHSWRFKAKKIDSPEALANKRNNRMLVDWIRTYKPVAE